MSKKIKVCFSILFLLAICFSSSTALAYDETVFEMDLIPCTFALCGVDSTATIHEGEIEVASTGQVMIEIESSDFVNSTLSVSYYPFNGLPQTIGILTTDDEGETEDEVVGILDTTPTMGMFIISDMNGVPQFVTGFSTSPSGDCITNDNDCDGIDDDIDEDDDNDGVADDDDANPTSANFFDGVQDSNELKTLYTQKMRSEKMRIKALTTSIKNSGKNQEMENDYKIRATELK